MNLVEATIESGDILFGQFSVPLDPARAPTRSEGRVVLGIRPESFEDAAFVSRELPTLEAEVVVLEELGSDVHVHFPAQTTRITLEPVDPQGEDAAELVSGSQALLNARVDPRTRARVGRRVRLAVDPGRFHFFDPESGESLLDHSRSAHAPVSASSAG
jgi:ABC-type sugar transport system ATPase subunit